MKQLQRTVFEEQLKLIHQQSEMFQKQQEKQDKQRELQQEQQNQRHAEEMNILQMKKELLTAKLEYFRENQNQNK